jgi:hypothetical protein
MNISEEFPDFLGVSELSINLCRSVSLVCIELLTLSRRNALIRACCKALRLHSVVLNVFPGTVIDEPGFVVPAGAFIEFSDLVRAISETIRTMIPESSAFAMR